MPAIRCYHPQNFRNDLAGFDDHHPVADPHIEPFDLVFVVQGSPADGGAGDEHRFQFRNWRDGPGAPDLHADSQHFGLRFLGLVFVRRRPARMFVGVPQPILCRQGIDFNDQPVHFVIERGLFLAPFFNELQYFIKRLAQPGLPIDAESEIAQFFQFLHMRFEGRAFEMTEPVNPDVERTFGGDGRVEQAQGPGGRVPGINERRLPFRLPRFVEFLEALAVHVDLAPHFQIRVVLEVTGQRQRNRAQGFQVGSDVFAGLAVAAGRPLHKLAMLISEGDAQPVEFEFHHILDLIGAEIFDDAVVEVAYLFDVVGVVEAEHGRFVTHRVEFFGKFATHALGRRIGRDRFGMRRFQRLQPCHQAVVFAVGDFRLVEGIIQMIVTPDCLPEFLNFL